MYTQQQLATAYTQSRRDHVSQKGIVSWEAMTSFDLFAKGYHAAHYGQQFVDTEEALNSLPAGTIIVSEQGGIYYATDVTVIGEVIESRRAWEEVGFENYRPSDDITLPARIMGNANDDWKN